MQRYVRIADSERSFEVSPLDVGFKLEKSILGLLHGVRRVLTKLVLAAVGWRWQTGRTEFAALHVGTDCRFPTL